MNTNTSTKRDAYIESKIDTCRDRDLNMYFDKDEWIAKENIQTGKKELKMKKKI